MNDTQEVSIKFINTVTGDSKLKEYEKRLENIYGYISSIKSGQSKATKEVKNAVEGLGKEVGKTNEKTKVLSNTMKNAFNTFGIIATIKASTKLFKTFSQLVNLSSSYVENLNLLEVAYSDVDKKTGKFNRSIEETSNEIEIFIDKMADVYGLDESNLTRQFGIFKQLANAMKLPSKEAGELSELMVKMTNDIASLYNLPISRASNALQSALAGQVRPIRGATGADITEKTLQNTVDALNLNKSISDLSYVEKRLIMVISLTEQLRNSQGDWGRTIESVANQVRIMHEQWNRLSRAVGNVFYPILEKILPYLNAVLMVLTEIFNLIASLMGFKMPEFDYSGLAGASDATIDLIDGMNEAGASANNLKDKLKGLRGFDKLNVINSPTNSGSSANAGAGIDPAIMDAFNASFSSYNDMMDEVNMKANQIRDAILDWLGFTDGTYKNLKLIAGVLGTIIGLKLLGVVTGIVTGTSRISKILGSGKIFSSIKWVVKTLKDFPGISLIVVGIIETIKGIKGLIDGTKSAFEGIIKIIEGIALAVAGVATLLGAWPVALIAGAVALTAYIAEWVVENWEKIKQFFSDIWNGFNDTIITPIVNWIAPIATWIWDTVIKPVIDFFKPIVDAVVEIFTLIVTKVEEIVVGIAKAVWSIIKKVGEIFLKIVEIFVALGKALYTYIIKPVIEWIGKAFKWIYDTLIRPIIDLFVNVGQWVYNNIIKPIWDKIVWLRDKAVDIFKTIGTTVVNFVSNSIKSAINGVLWAIENTINGFIKLLNGAIKLINKIPGVNISTVSELSIPRLQKGMDFVPKDYYGPVYLDYGERVLTKQENRDYSMRNKDVNYKTSSDSSKEQPMNATFIIQVGSKEVAREVLSDLQGMAKTNGRPIVLGG